jgi:hypothetical protein
LLAAEVGELGGADLDEHGAADVAGEVGEVEGERGPLGLAGGVSG